LLGTVACCKERCTEDVFVSIETDKWWNSRKNLMAKSQKPAKPSLDEFEHVTPSSRQEWRGWLEKHHADSPGIWLVYFKKHTGQPTVAYDDAVEEALCFGWVDSKPNTLDDDRYKMLFSPRNAKSPWSKLNKARVARLIEQGLMTPAGLEKIEVAKADGSWSVYDEIEDLTMPDDLNTALDENVDARRNFDGFSPSSKKNILWWIASAKRPETRSKRVEETVRLAAVGKRANHPVDRD
jgi:uncharacterized protein YdeI (YjbR/CyaY-like superfamily)